MSISLELGERLRQQGVKVTDLAYNHLLLGKTVDSSNTEQSLNKIADAVFDFVTLYQSIPEDIAEHLSISNKLAWNLSRNLNEVNKIMFLGNSYFSRYDVFY